MSDPNSTRERVAEIFSKELHLSVPDEDMDLFESGVLDSLSFVDLLVHIEKQFGVKVTLEELELENFQTLARISDFVSRHAKVGDEAGSAEPGGARSSRQARQCG